jgi:hypothetical protein
MFTIGVDMYRRLWVLPVLIFLLVVSACAPGGELVQPAPTSQPVIATSTPTALPATSSPPTVQEPSIGATITPTSQPEAALKARETLAHALNLSPNLVLIRQVDAVDWPDTCLGAAGKDEMCAQMVVPGYRVILEARGQTYEYHTNQDGTMIRASNENANTEGVPDVEQAVIARAAQDLGMEASGIKIIKVEAVEWPDSCLGVQVKGMMCLMVITPGYRVTLEAGGQSYEYHTDSAASRIVRFGVK